MHLMDAGLSSQIFKEHPHSYDMFGINRNKQAFTSLNQTKGNKLKGLSS